VEMVAMTKAESPLISLSSISERVPRHGGGCERKR
jgi:hypothetical protein